MRVQRVIEGLPKAWQAVSTVFPVTWGVWVTTCVFHLFPGNCKDPRERVRTYTWISESQQEKCVTFFQSTRKREVGDSGC